MIVSVQAVLLLLVEWLLSLLLVEWLLSVSAELSVSEASSLLCFVLQGQSGSSSPAVRDAKGGARVLSRYAHTLLNASCDSFGDFSDSPLQCSYHSCIQSSVDL